MGIAGKYGACLICGVPLLSWFRVKTCQECRHKQAQGLLPKIRTEEEAKTLIKGDDNEQGGIDDGGTPADVRYWNV